MSYSRYLRSLVAFRHPRLSYFDNCTPAYTRPIVARNALLVYSIVAAFALFELGNYRRALAVRRQAVRIPE